MNCREGDLAIVVKSYAGNEGKIVRCIRFIGDIEWLEGGTGGWEIDTYLTGYDGLLDNVIADDQLRPIRDSDKQDEMLSIVSLKEKVKL